jgi:putative zinc finger protein
MRNCKNIQSQFAEAYYGELAGADAERFEEHIKSCPACAAQYAEIRLTLDACQRDYIRPEPQEDYWDGYWSTLEQKIETEQARRISLPLKLKEFVSILFPPIPASYRPVFAGAALLVIGIFIGRTFLPGPGGVERPDRTMASLQQAHVGQVHERTANYFGKAKLVLLGIVNCDTESDGPLRASFESQARVSRQLLLESTELRQELTALDDAGLLELIAELETVLLQAANLDQDNQIVEIRLIQQGAERKALLFKIAVGQSMLADYAAAEGAVYDPDHKSTGKAKGKIL